jgi:hypothetical protein
MGETCRPANPRVGHDLTYLLDVSRLDSTLTLKLCVVFVSGSHIMGKIANPIDKDIA